MEEKIAKTVQTIREFTENCNINAVEISHKKATEIFAEFEETSYELISQHDEDQHEDYIGNIADSWNNIDDMKIKNKNHIAQENSN